VTVSWYTSHTHALSVVREPYSGVGIQGPGPKDTNECVRHSTIATSVFNLKFTCLRFSLETWPVKLSLSTLLFVG
jgi:hypothetical protein